MVLVLYRNNGLSRLSMRQIDSLYTEERSVQEYTVRVLKGIRCLVYKTGSEEWWRKCGLGMGDAMRDLLWILEAVETGVDTENYPRAMY